MKTSIIPVLEELATIHGEQCISIFLPTHEGGKETLNREDQLLFKNQIKAVESALKKQGLDDRKIATSTQSLHELESDQGFWRRQTRGLAVFVTDNLLRKYHLPLPVKSYVYIGHEFYVKPLLPILLNNPEFYLLTLNLQEIKLFYGNRDHLDEVLLDDVLPQRMEEVVGYDYRQKFLGYHAQKQGGHSQATFHGHGDWQEDEKDEILAFFRAVDKAVSRHLNASPAPLIVACLDYLWPLYQEANTCNLLLEKPLKGNPQHIPLEELQNDALNILKNSTEDVRSVKRDKIEQFHDTGRMSTDIKQIVPAALGGRVDALFLADDKEIWGIYDPRDASVRIDLEQTPSNTSLTNLISLAVHRNGGLVFLEDQTNLPFPSTGVNALFRY